jgi:hypothetical protein
MRRRTVYGWLAAVSTCRPARTRGPLSQPQSSSRTRAHKSVGTQERGRPTALRPVRAAPPVLAAPSARRKESHRDRILKRLYAVLPFGCRLYAPPHPYAPPRLRGPAVWLAAVCRGRPPPPNPQKTVREGTARASLPRSCHKQESRRDRILKRLYARAPPAPLSPAPVTNKRATETESSKDCTRGYRPRLSPPLLSQTREPPRPNPQKTVREGTARACLPRSCHTESPHSLPVTKGCMQGCQARYHPPSPSSAALQPSGYLVTQTRSSGHLGTHSTLYSSIHTTPSLQPSCSLVTEARSQSRGGSRPPGCRATVPPPLTCLLYENAPPPTSSYRTAASPHLHCQPESLPTPPNSTPAREPPRLPRDRACG